MPSIFDGLPDVFIQTLGQTVTVIPAGGVAREITAVFRRSAQPDPFESGAFVRETTLGARSVDVTDLADGDLVEVGVGEQYAVRTIEPDGRGMTRILLEAV